MEKEQIFYFGSGCSLKGRMLSNLYGAQIEIDGVLYPSVEHAFQEKKFNFTDSPFQKGGILDKEEGLHLVLETEKKCKYWLDQKKCIGIVAKMFASKKTLNHRFVTSRKADFYSDWEMWKPLLLAKFEQNPECKEALLSTGNLYLIEFNRGAKRACDYGSEPYWSGLLKDGKLYGKNTMGLYLMKIRNILKGRD